MTITAARQHIPIKHGMLALWRGLYAARLNGGNTLDDASLAVCRKTPGTKGVHTTTFTSIVEAAKFADASATQFDCYFRVGLLRPDFDTRNGTKRGEASDTINMPALLLDIDVGPEHFATRAEALRLIEIMSVSLKPGALVSSKPNGGLHAYFLFRGSDGDCEIDDDRNEIAALSERLHAFARSVMAQIAPAAKLDSIRDLARILRIPSTVNHKGDATCPTLFD